MHVTAAPKAARAATKATGFYRRELDQASRKEQDAIRGATERREFLTKEFQDKSERAEAAISETETLATSFSDAAAILKHPDTVKPRDRLTRLARCGALLGIDAAKLAPALDHAAGRASEAAQKAQARMDAAAPDLEATALHALLLSKLPDHGWNPKAAELAPIRSAYQGAITEARKRSAHK